MLNIMRWLTVLPGAAVCGFLSTFALHWVLYGTLTASGVVEPYPELPERLLTPFAVALAFVWAGSRIAPSRKVETAAVLFGAWLLLVGAGIALSLTGAYWRLTDAPTMGRSRARRWNGWSVYWILPNPS